MKTQRATLAFALITSLYGMTSAMAEPFNDQGPGTASWTPANPSLTVQQDYGSQTATMRYGNRSNTVTASSTGATTQQSCNLPPRVGFNQGNRFPTC